MTTDLPVSRTGATDREVEYCEILIAPFTVCDRPLADDDTMCAEHRIRMLADLVVQMREERDATHAAAAPDRDPVVDAWTKLHDGQPVHVSELAPAAEVNSGPLREFAEFVVSLDDDPESPGRQARRTVTLAQLVDRARAALLAEQPGGRRLCDDRGPRIGGEGCPRCRLQIGHTGSHRPFPEDGWGDISW